MLGMDMMFANLVGMTPDQMKEAANKTMSLLENAARNMNEILVTQKRIEEKLDELLDSKESKANGSRKRLTGNTSNNSEHVEL